MVVRRLRENWIGQYAFPVVIWSLTDRSIVVVCAVACPETGRVRLRLHVDVLQIELRFAFAIVEDIALFR